MLQFSRTDETVLEIRDGSGDFRSGSFRLLDVEKRLTVDAAKNLADELFLPNLVEDGKIDI